MDNIFAYFVVTLFWPVCMTRLELYPGVREAGGAGVASRCKAASVTSSVGLDPPDVIQSLEAMMG